MLNGMPSTRPSGSEGLEPQVFRYEKPGYPEGRGKGVQLLGRTDLAFVAVQRLKAVGGETNLHTHAWVDGFWMVLTGRVRFYTTDDELIADLGPMEGVVIPRNYPYWFGAEGVESEILQFEANIKRQTVDSKHDTGRIDVGPRRSTQIDKPPRAREDVVGSN
jgi:mannose-6-phosphate isomerase-like protein (cupin superfamily)